MLKYEEKPLEAEVIPGSDSISKEAILDEEKEEEIAPEEEEALI